MGVFENFKRAAGIGSIAKFVWTLLPAAWQLAAIAGLAAVTGHYGYTQLGPARSLYYTSGVVAFGLISFFCYLRIQQMIGIYKRVSVPNIGARSVALDKNETEIQHIILGLDIRNDSQQPISTVCDELMQSSLAARSPTTLSMTKTHSLFQPSAV